MSSFAGVQVEGLAGMSRAFARADMRLQRELRGELKIAGIPVASAAETLAHSEIPGIGVPRPRSWGKMRLGVSRHIVYIAPKQKRKAGGRGSRRPNLAPLLLERAMEPALEQNRAQVVARINLLLTIIARDWGRVG